MNEDPGGQDHATIVADLHSAEVGRRLDGIARAAQASGANEQILEALAECLGAPQKVVQRRAADAFVSLSDKGVVVDDVLLATLQSPEIYHRWGAAYALSQIDRLPLAALPVLLECLGVSDADVRWSAAQILCAMPDSMAVRESLLPLLHSNSPEQRKMAAYCLRDLAQPNAAVEQALITALADVEPAVRLAALSALARNAGRGDATAIHIRALLDDPDPRVRRAAAAALGRLDHHSPAILQALRGVAQAQDSSLQRAAQWALQQLTKDPTG